MLCLRLLQDNADKLDIPGADRKKMVEYRAQLDAERDAALAKGRNRPKRKVRHAMVEVCVCMRDSVMAFGRGRA